MTFFVSLLLIISSLTPPPPKLPQQSPSCLLRLPHPSQRLPQPPSRLPRQRVAKPFLTTFWRRLAPPLAGVLHVHSQRVSTNTSRSVLPPTHVHMSTPLPTLTSPELHDSTASKLVTFAAVRATHTASVLPCFTQRSSSRPSSASHLTTHDVTATSHLNPQCKIEHCFRAKRKSKKKHGLLF